MAELATNRIIASVKNDMTVSEHYNIPVTLVTGSSCKCLNR